jgi:hypothetical protein
LSKNDATQGRLESFFRSLGGSREESTGTNLPLVRSCACINNACCVFVDAIDIADDWLATAIIRY